MGSVCSGDSRLVVGSLSLTLSLFSLFSLCVRYVSCIILLLTLAVKTSLALQHEKYKAHADVGANVGALGRAVLFTGRAAASFNRLGTVPVEEEMEGAADGLAGTIEGGIEGGLEDGMEDAADGLSALASSVKEVGAGAAKGAASAAASLKASGAAARGAVKGKKK